MQRTSSSFCGWPRSISLSRGSDDPSCSIQGWNHARMPRVTVSADPGSRVSCIYPAPFYYSSLPCERKLFRFHFSSAGYRCHLASSERHRHLEMLNISSMMQSTRVFLSPEFTVTYIPSLFVPLPPDTRVDSLRKPTSLKCLQTYASASMHNASGI